ncbi:Ig-like domain-containing protein [Streptomyces sp. NPDC056121]|uniref:Ig-like domain-containing protein n=1 Tax=unclassified Streptomyces TaxID=2593676 RepID=UPI0035DA7195
MTDWFPLGEARVAHPRNPGLGGLLQLAADTDPLHPVVPGQKVTLALTLHPSGTPYRTYGYLMEEGLGPAAVARVQGMAHMADKGRYAAYATGAEPRTVTCLLKIDDEAPEGAVVLPHVVVGLMANQGDKLISSSRLNDRGFRVRRGWLPGRSMTLQPGARVTIPAGYSPEQGLLLTGSTFARHGTVTCTSDGAVSYQADPGHRGYDRFALSYEAVGGHTVWSEITLFLGYLGEAPGALPETG